MTFWKHALVAAGLATAGLAHAGPTDLGTGPGTYSFSDNHDSAWYVTLQPGTYTISSSVSSSGFDLTNVWFSYSKDHKSTGGNDIGDFNQLSPTDFAWSIPTLTITEPTQLYVDINTNLGKLTDGQFNGTLVISQAPVPEPATPALLLAGLGLMAFVARRRLR